MKIKKCLNYILVGLILIAFCLSIAAFAKANTASKEAEQAQATANSDTEEIKKEVQFIEENLPNIGKTDEIVPYTKNGERRYLVVCQQYFFGFIVCKVENGEIVILTEGRR